MNVPEISEVKNKLSSLKKNGFVQDWELPYENLLTRRSAAIFFLTPSDDNSLPTIIKELEIFDHFKCFLNDSQKLSRMQYQIEFKKDVD